MDHNPQQTGDSPKSDADHSDVPELMPQIFPTNPAARLARFLNETFPRAYAYLSLAPRLLIADFWIRKLERSGAGRRLSRLAINEYKTSDTVFVLGTGASLNDYDHPRWKEITEHDSIGMNFFLLHDHVPTFHVMEDVHAERADLLRTRYADWGDYSGTPLIVKTQVTNFSRKRINQRASELHALPSEVLRQVYLSIDLLAAGRTEEHMKAAYARLRRWGLWKQKRRFQLLTKRRGSVSYIINLAVRMGYRRIVLCGVDLNHSEYFYDRRRRELEAKGLKVPPNLQEGTVHETNDPTTNPVTIQQVVMAIKTLILDDLEVELLVGSETSALHPDLAVFDWTG